MSKILPDLEFPLLNDRTCEGSRAVSPWVNAYLNYRLDSNADIIMSKNYLDMIGQNSSMFASRFRGALLGLALGDALGTTLEFSQRDSHPKVTELVGGGPFNLKPGEWTDDTSMALCLAHSLIRRESLILKDQIELYIQWWRHGAFSVNRKCFDIGNTVAAALGRYEQSGDPYAGDTDPNSAGNGSLMRLAPVALFFFGKPDACISACGASSETTHRAQEAIDSCKYFGGLLFGAIRGVAKKELTEGVYEPYPNAWNRNKLEPAVINAAKTSHLKSRDQIKSTGYVIDTLEAAIWAFHNTNSFEEGAILAANLGDDSDTVAAVYGQLAGAYYGEYNINPEWIKKLARHHIFYVYADKLLRFGVCDSAYLFLKKNRV